MTASYRSAYSGATNNGSTSSLTIVMAVSAVPTGYTLCAGGAFINSGTPTYSCADNGSGSWTAGPVLVGSPWDVATFVCKSASGNPTTVTITQTGGSSQQFATGVVECFSGILPTTIIDGSSTNYQPTPGTGTDAITSGNFTCTYSGLRWGCGFTQNSTVPGTNYTAGSVFLKSEYNLAGVSGTNAVTWTQASAGYTIMAGLGLQVIPCNPGSQAMMGMGCSIGWRAALLGGGAWRAARALESNEIITRRGLILPRVFH